MSKTSMAVTMRAYSVSTDDQASIAAWTEEYIRPSILINAPTRDIGEHELVRELTDASYQLQGFRDARRRHFISRRFPQLLSEIALMRFLDQAFDAAEISDGFHGVDCIDLSDWLDCRFPQENEVWQKFISYVQSHPETDFVFLAYGDHAAANRLATSISSSTGNAVLPVELSYPSPEQLTDAFVAQNPDAFTAYRDDIASQLTARASSGRHTSYAAIRAAAAAATHSISIDPDTSHAIKAALGVVAVPKSGSTFGIGFTGGER